MGGFSVRGATGPSITVHSNARPCCGVGRLSSAYGRHCPSPCPPRHTFLRLAVVFRLYTATQGSRAAPASFTCPFNRPVQTRLVEFNSPFNSPVQTRLVEFNSSVQTRMLEFNSPFNSPVQTRLLDFNSPFNSPVQTRLVELNSPFNSPV